MDINNKKDILKLQDKLKRKLSDSRYLHTIGVAYTAGSLAMKYSCDINTAVAAGLLHDCAKCLPKEKLKQIICDLPDLCEGELINQKTYHAPAGKIIAKNEFKITDEEILSSIRWHTLGKHNMTDFEKIIYLADKIETKTRPSEWAEPIRKALEEENGLNKAMLISYKNTIKSLADRNLKICKTTVELYNELLENINF